MRRRRESIDPPEHADPAVFLPLPHLPFLVLLALADGARHGWAVIRRIEDISGGRDAPSTGSLYLAMSRLEERGLLEEEAAPSDADGRRRYFRLTPLGRRVLHAETERLASLVDLSRRWSPAPADAEER